MSLAGIPPFDVLCIGRSCIDLYAHEIGVPITQVRSFDAYVGGCPTNVSVGTRRLGLRSALLTALGTDQVGDFVLHFLETEGVDLSYSPRFRDRRTSAVLLTIQPPDRFPITFYRDNCADIALSIEHVRGAPIAASRAVFLTGTGVSLDPSRTATFLAAELARAHGTRLVIDLDYRPSVWPSAAAYGTTIRSLISRGDVVVGTEDEVIAASGSTDAAQGACRLLERGPSLLVVKRGGEGARVYHPDGTCEDVPPFRVDVLNVLGAGDAFASGFLYGYLKGWPPAVAARFGNATGAIIVTRHGCANFMPTLDEVRSFVRERGEAALLEATA